MDSNFSLLIIIVLLTTSWYYYTKYKESEKINNQIQYNVNKITMENSNYRTRIKDLQKYKNDVSKTFKILDTELTNINNHVEKSHNHFQLSSNPISTSRINSPGHELTSHINNRVNLLTPDMLNNLIDNMNQEFTLFTPATTNMNPYQHNNNYNTDNTDNTNNTDNNGQHMEQIGTSNEQQNEQQISINNDQYTEPKEDVNVVTSIGINNTEHTENNNEHFMEMHNEQDKEYPNEQSSSSRLMNPVSIFPQESNNPTLGSSILRSMSFPNLPNAYQRLMIPISETISGNRYVNSDVRGGMINGNIETSMSNN